MPTLIANYKKQVYVNQLKKAVSTIEQGFQKMMADDGVDRLTYTSIWPQLNDNLVSTLKDEDLKKYFNYLGISQAAPTNGGYVAKFLNETDENNGDPLGFDEFIKFPDGMWFELIIDSEDEDINQCVGYAFIDTNGIKGPNMYGRDIFYLQVLNKGILKDFSQKERCVTGTADGCYNRIVENGWKMDY